MNQERQFTLHRGSDKDRSAPVDCHSALFRLHAPSSTDLWRKPPVEVFNTPSLTTQLRTEEFKSARVTVSGEWVRLYDQAGLVILWCQAGKSPSDDEPPVSWIKTGVEFYNGTANLSTVATPATSTSDWSLIPLKENVVTIEIERESDSPSLWVYLVEDGNRKAVREITWAFSSERLLEDMHIGPYVARPTKVEGGDNEEVLAAQFTDFAVMASTDVDKS